MAYQVPFPLPLLLLLGEGVVADPAVFDGALFCVVVVVVAAPLPVPPFFTLEQKVVNHCWTSCKLPASQFPLQISTAEVYKPWRVL
jgi:hypothetical protein